MEWATVEVGRVALCKMGARKIYEGDRSDDGDKGKVAQERKVVDEVYEEVAGVDVTWANEG